MWRYRSGKYVPESWKETHEKNEKNLIKTLYYDDFYVYDFDVCGENEIYFAFSTGKYYKLTYAWWRSYEDNENQSEYEIEEISKNEAKNIASDRDWLVI